MELKEEVFKSSETERRFAEAAFQTLMLICLTFVCTLTCMLLLGSVQQRAGLIAADVMSWSGTPAGVEIVNAAVSHLKLDATPLGKAGMQDAPDEDAASVLPPGSTPSYALCGSSWYGLSPLDYALLAGVSYIRRQERPARADAAPDAEQGRHHSEDPRHGAPLARVQHQDLRKRELVLFRDGGGD
ncbi:unnamed protein product [Prorocentrum cordatum]|uniref:Uncharacterized protein n=1 Tax=Prorocentrum cordatum TaxID=2364126 RepID=A0ABN9XVD1_9DINO|nr:unnamed protein product [Polarella glacialis]